MEQHALAYAAKLVVDVDIDSKKPMVIEPAPR